MNDRVEHEIICLFAVVIQNILAHTRIAGQIDPIDDKHTHVSVAVLVKTFDSRKANSIGETVYALKLHKYNGVAPSKKGSVAI